MSNMNTDEIIVPTMTVQSAVIQVGAPAFPTGVLVSGSFEIQGTRWIRKPWYKGRGWKSVPVPIEKKFAVEFNDTEVERFLGEWKEGCIDYEAWRAEMAHRHELFVAKLEEE